MATTYATVETLLAGIFSTGQDAQKKQFRGRLKHLKRLGLPLAFTPGRGAKKEYSDDHIDQLAFALELSEFGLDPTVIVGFVKANWSAVIYPELLECRRGVETYLFLYPNLMSSTWANEHPLRYDFLDGSAFRDRYGSIWGDHRRAMVINLGALVKQLDAKRAEVEASAAGRGA